MKFEKLMIACSWIGRVAFLALCLSPLPANNADAQVSGEIAQPAGSKKSYSPASVQARAGLRCKLYSGGRSPDSGLTIFTDDDGYARFHAVKMAAGETNTRHVLDCASVDGGHFVYPVDLASEDTFASRPINLAKERGRDRAPLKGDPLSYTRSQLIQAGYGLRPDPVRDSAAYLTWLVAASAPGRFLEAKRPNFHAHNPITAQSPQWVGFVLGGAPNYVAVTGMFNVPRAIPGGDGTTNTSISVWNGLGGFGTGSGLIQGGVIVSTTPTTASYIAWREYCCGDPSSNGYGGAFVPNPGDLIYAQNWYCDAIGNPNLNGGYGCTFLQDLNSKAILSCTSATGSPCWSVKALPLCSASPRTASCMTLGLSAEFVIENESNQLTPPTAAFTDFIPTVRMSGSALSSQTNKYSQSISTDPVVFLLTDFTNSTTRINVILGPTDTTCFTIFKRSDPSPEVDCSIELFPPFVVGERARRDEIMALVLFGVIQDGGGFAIIGGKIRRIAPRGPVSEILAALPPTLAQRLSPLLKDYPSNAEAAEHLVKQLRTEFASYLKGQLLGQQMP